MVPEFRDTSIHSRICRLIDSLLRFFQKKQYVKTIEKRDDFLDVGFLLTDYATDFYDGKQITLCVYI